jgi:metal-responsive CopG/Arc/MetJ family transcriptional regulator
MATIQVVMEGDLVKAADQAARRLKVNRSRLIREALREHLRRLHHRELERQEREAYERIPDDPAEFALWDKVAAWPKEWRAETFGCSGSPRPTSSVRWSS